MPPVRFVKTIGDAVMLVSTETSALLDAMLSLVEATDADEELPQLRVGVAYGRGGQPCRGLVRQSGQPGQPRHVGGPARLRPGGAGGL